MACNVRTSYAQIIPLDVQSPLKKFVIEATATMFLVKDAPTLKVWFLPKDEVGWLIAVWIADLKVQEMRRRDVFKQAFVELPPQRCHFVIDNLL
jgi:hypothetical protein